MTYDQDYEDWKTGDELYWNASTRHKAGIFIEHLTQGIHLIDPSGIHRTTNSIFLLAREKRIDTTRMAITFMPATCWHACGEGVYWRPYQHYGTRCYAGERVSQKNGDTSGCVTTTMNGMFMCEAPFLVEARLYRTETRDISAILCYPNSTGPLNQYFWEVYDSTHEPQKFLTEEDMEQHVLSIARMKT